MMFRVAPPPKSLEVTIGRQGTVNDLRVVSGHPILVPAAVEAVKRWKYQPTLLEGEPHRSGDHCYGEFHAMNFQAFYDIGVEGDRAVGCRRAFASR